MFVSRLVKLIGVVTLLNIGAKFFGFLREITIAYIYGTSYQADSIITAFTIPNFLYVVIGGAVTTSFISVYSKLDKDLKQDFFQTLMTGLAIIMTGITMLFLLFPDFWMSLFFGGMSEEALDLTSKLFVVTAPATLFLVLSMPLSGLLNMNEFYRYSTFTTLLFNMMYVIVGLLLTPVLNEYSYALGATMGALSMLLFLAFQINNQQLVSFRFKMVKMVEMKRLIWLALPIIIGGATLQFYTIIQRVFASGLDEGAVAAVNYASKMTQLPQGVLMASVTTIIYPILAKAAGENDTVKMERAYTKGFRLLTLILLPASVYIFIYAKEIITLVFQYGSFGEESTNYTYPLLQLFSISVFSLALNTYITRFFYALEHTLLPNLINVLAVFGVNILIIILLIDDLGAAAIAVGTVVSTIVNMLGLIWFARSKLNLILCSKMYLLKLGLFVGLIVSILWFTAMLIDQYLLLSLFAGGLVTIGLTLGGLKTVK